LWGRGEGKWHLKMLSVEKKENEKTPLLEPKKERFGKDEN